MKLNASLCYDCSNYAKCPRFTSGVNPDGVVTERVKYEDGYNDRVIKCPNFKKDYKKLTQKELAHLLQWSERKLENSTIRAIKIRIKELHLDIRVCYDDVETFKYDFYLKLC